MASFRSPFAAKSARIVNSSIPIVDCHAHLWNLGAWNSPWIKDIPALNKNFGVPEYEKDTSLLDVRASVFVETSPIKNDFTKETKYVTKICADPSNSVQSIIGSCDINSPLLPNHVNQFISGPSKPFFRGVRDVAITKPTGYLTSSQAIDNYAYLGEHGLLYEILMQPDDLLSIVPIVKALRGKTTFVIDHCGGIQGLCGNKEKESKWKTAIEQLGKCDNAILKVSGLAGGWGGDARVDQNGWDFEFQREYVEFSIAAFNPNNQVFGLDWPINNMVPGACLTKYVTEVENVARMVGRQISADKLFHLNAFRIYNINLENTLHDYVGRHQEDRYATQTRMEFKWNKPSMGDKNTKLIDCYWNTATIGGGKKI